MRVSIGRTGLAILLILFAIVAIEDAYIWLVSGAVPGLEFFAGLIVVLVVWLVAIYEARIHPPSR